MGKFQQLRAKAISLRGAIAMGGALVMATSMAQASGTLAQSGELREAKAGIATQNYFPTPLTAEVRCRTNPSGAPVWDRRAEVSWTPVSGATGYRLELVDWGSNGNGTDVIRTVDVDASTTTVGDITAVIGGTRYQLWPRVRTINGPAISSGYVTPTQRISYKSISTSRTECENTSPPTLPNQPWENQHDWDPDIPFATGPSPSIFGALFDEDADLLGELPEGDELTYLDDAAIDFSPDIAEQESAPPSSSPTRSTPSTPTSSRSTSTPTSAGEDATESTSPPPGTSGSPTAPATSAAVTRSSTQSTLSSSPTPPATSTRARESIRAQVGDDPIAVGTSQARLEEADGHTQLIITRNGSQVCTAEVDGASRIESSDGELTVTVSGRTKSVDPETCKVD